MSIREGRVAIPLDDLTYMRHEAFMWTSNSACIILKPLFSLASMQNPTRNVNGGTIRKICTRFTFSTGVPALMDLRFNLKAKLNMKRTIQGFCLSLATMPDWILSRTRGTATNKDGFNAATSSVSFFTSPCRSQGSVPPSKVYVMLLACYLNPATILALCRFTSGMTASCLIDVKSEL